MNPDPIMQLAVELRNARKEREQRILDEEEYKFLERNGPRKAYLPKVEPCSICGITPTGEHYHAETGDQKQARKERAEWQLEYERVRNL